MVLALVWVYAGGREFHDRLLRQGGLGSIGLQFTELARAATGSGARGGTKTYIVKTDIHTT